MIDCNFVGMTTQVHTSRSLNCSIMLEISSVVHPCSCHRLLAEHPSIAFARTSPGERHFLPESTFLFGMRTQLCNVHVWWVQGLLYRPMRSFNDNFSIVSDNIR